MAPLIPDWWVDWILSRIFRRSFETPRRVLKPFVEHGMTVLDVGSGNGDHSLAMARLVGPSGRVVAVDMKDESIAALQRRAAKSKLADRIETRVCGEDDLQIAELNGRIDLALAVYVVHHAADVAMLMEQVHAALRSGGTFLVVEPRHHASDAEREAVESKARTAGFTIIDHPRLRRDWAVRFAKG